MPQRDTALVTGVSGGIGRALAEAFAARGHDLIVVVPREAQLDALAERCRRRHGAEISVIAMDFTAEGEDEDRSKPP